MAKEKIICIGLPRTGTTSLGAALRYFGNNHLSFNKNYKELYKNKNISALMKIADKYDSFDDNPWCYLYKELDKKYPNSKYILTIRKDTETWFQSMCNLHDILGPRKDVPAPYNRKAEVIDEYITHNSEIQEYFQNTDKLLIMSFEDGDGWKQLCEFLNKPVPKIPFPHAHKTPSSLVKLPKPIKFIIRLSVIGPAIRYLRRISLRILKNKKT